MKHCWLLIPVTLLVAVSGESGSVTINGNSYTYTDHPRVWFDGPGGTLTTALQDPDGAGPLVAQKASDANPAYVALKAKIRSCVATDPPCVPYDKGLALAEAALDWFMDNSQTNSLRAAKYWINNIETFYSQFQFACDFTQQNCGIGSHSDWPSTDISHYAYAYTLIRSELSAGERTTFGQKMLNDNDQYNGDSGCTPQLQAIAGTTVNYAGSGATTITGSGLSGATAGRLLYVRAPPQYLWATAATIDSDSQITLSGPLKSWGGINGNSVAGGTLWELKPWTSSTCGYEWALKNSIEGPRDTIGRYTKTTLGANVVAGATTVTVANGEVWASLTAPYYVKFRTEILKVTNRSGNTLTVDRAQLGTSQTNGYTGDTIFYHRYLPFGSSQAPPPIMNLDLTKLGGHLPIALALLDDHARAAALVDEAATSISRDVVPASKEVWTGLQQSGSSNYGPGRVMTNTILDVAALKMLTGSPSLDLTSGNWIKNLVYYTLYASVPGSPSLNIPWGQPDIASTADYRTNGWAFTLPYFYPASDEAKYWNYWQRTATSQYTSSFLSTSVNDRVLLYALLWQDETDPSASYTSLPTQRAFKPDTVTGAKGMDAWISRTGWSSAGDTLVFGLSAGMYYTVDHAGTGAPGAYKVYKGGWTLGENGAYDTGQGVDTNMILFGGAANLISPVHGMSATLDRYSAGTGWAYGRTNAQAAYTAATAVTRAQRNLVHFKASGQPDYLVAYDTAATSAAKAIGQNLHYDKTAGQGSSISDTLPDIVWTGPDRRVSTKVVLPSGTGAARTASSLTNSFREYLCASSDGSTCASVTSAAFLIVHKPSTSTSDAMPTVNALATIDSDFDGVEIADASAPSVAVFAKVADQNAGSFTTTLAGTAQIIVSGLVAGTYDVTKDAGAYLSSQSVDANGVLAFTGSAAAYAFNQTGTADPPVITTTSLPNGVVGQAYSACPEFDNGALPVSWDLSAGTLPSGLSQSAVTGCISGTPTATGTSNFTVRVTDNLAQTDTQALALTIQTPPPTLSVTAQPGSTSAVIGFATPGLAYDQTCTVQVSQTVTVGCQPEETSCVVQVGSASSSSGGSRRQVTVTGLTAQKPSSATVTCGTVAAGSVSFTTQTASGSGATYTYKAKAPAWVKTAAIAAHGNTNLLGLAVCFDANCTSIYSCKLLSSCPGDVCSVSRSLAAGVHYVWHRWSWMPLGAEVCAETTTYATTAGRKGLVAIP